MLCRLLIAVVVLCYSSPALLWGRIRVSPGDEMVRELAQESKFVFRGKVVQLALTKDQPGYKEGVAFIAVDRWYKGNHQQLDVSIFQPICQSDKLGQQGSSCAGR